MLNLYLKFTIIVNKKSYKYKLHHSNQHSSKTPFPTIIVRQMFCNHSNPHSSKTSQRLS